MNSKNTWFEVYQQGKDLIDGTETIAIFDTIEEANDFIKGKSDLFIDKWEMSERGIVKRTF